jgi:tRNA nucleotidyltransferase (CCA-adding enzyme)
VTTTEIAQSLLQKLESQAPSPAGQALALCRRLAREQQVPLYLVGGAVRDLILDRDGYDLDLVLESDAGAFAALLAAEQGLRATTHEQFGTASVAGSGFRIDLARARRESYPHPGSLPVVEPATIFEDLSRRDFTINAIALRLEPAPVEVIDPFRGVADIRSGLIRVLHERSFQDDATRMLRAVRYPARLGFKIATQTEALMRRDATYFGTLSGPRLRHELELLFTEPAAVDGVRQAQRLGLLQAIHPALHLTEDVAARWQAATREDALAPLDALGFCVIADPRDEGTARSVSRWLHLEGRIETALADLVRLRVQSPKLGSMGTKPSEATALLDRFDSAAIWALAVLDDGDTAATCQEYLRSWRHVRQELTGDDLIAMGMVAGPRLGDALRRLRAARLDGSVTTRDSEVAMARELL